jgi:HAD superfamily hydrolase (TIGR01662 family)
MNFVRNNITALRAIVLNVKGNKLMSQVTMVMGFPASGKSTLTKDLVEKGAVSLNRDTEGGTIADLLPKMEVLLKDNKDIVLDNLFALAEVRKPFIELAKKQGADISCLLMGTSIEDAQFNAVQRAIGLLGQFPNPEVIKKAKHTNVFPPLVLFKYKKEFQKPTTDEGFSEVKTIKFVRKVDPTFTNKAIILDYDGTLRECINGNGKYPVAKDQIEIKPNRKAVLDAYKKKGYLLLGMSNQSGVAKGELTHETAVELFEHTNKLIGVDIEFRFCPHQSAPISCYCRKPMNGAGVEFIMKHKLDAKQCIMVGDYTSDETFAKRSGFQYADQADFFK